MQKPPKETYPNNIGKLRKAKKLSQQTVADALKMSQPNMTDLENGRIRLSFDKAMVLAELFECSLSDLSDEFSSLNNTGANAPYSSPEYFEIQNLCLLEWRDKVIQLPLDDVYYIARAVYDDNKGASVDAKKAAIRMAFKYEGKPAADSDKEKRIKP